MAASPAPLVWDFHRYVRGAAGLGSCLEYYTEDAQSLYLADGLKTRLQVVEEGHWSDSPLSEQEIEILDLNLSASAWDHALTGQLYGVGITGGMLYFYRYLYARELTDIVKDGTWRAKNDSQITQLSLTLKNPGEDQILSETSMFEPGARLTVSVAMGDSRPYPIGVAFMDEIDFDAQAATFSLSGRNSIGFRLQQQTFDESTEFTGNGHEVVEWIFQRAGITNYAIGPSDASNDWVFEPGESFYSGLQKVFEIFLGWDMIELPDGTVVVGYAAWRQQYLTNSVYQFRLGTDVIKRRTRKSADAAYSNVRVTGKDADGEELDPVYLPVSTFDHWALGSTKTKHVAAADGMTQEQLQEFAEQTAADLAHIGVGESFTSPMRPWLLVGDVASISLDGFNSEDLGLITSITHRFGDSGFFTDFSVDSGGVASALTRSGTELVTRSAAVNGYNRRQDLADLIGIVGQTQRNIVGGTGATGGGGGEPGPPGEAARITGATATASTLSSGSPATVDVTAGGSDMDRSFAFAFGIPAGPAGRPGDPGEAATINAVEASASTLPAGSPATANVTAGGSVQHRSFSFAFGIPQGADGAPGSAGRGIVSVALTGSSGLVDTYTITYSDGTTSTFTVTNGADGADLNNIILEDTVTSAKYQLIVESGRIELMEVSPSLTANSPVVIDLVTAAAYTLAAENGRIILTEV